MLQARVSWPQPGRASRRDLRSERRQPVLRAAQQVFRRPFARPFCRCGAVVLMRRRTMRRVQLHETLHLETRGMKEGGIHSPWLRKNSTPSSEGQAIRCRSSGMQELLGRMARLVGDAEHGQRGFVRNTSRPRGRSRRAASGSQRVGSQYRLAPYSEIARSNDPSGNGTSSALASTSGNSMPVSAMARRAVSSCAGVMSTPTGRAPRIASRAEKYAVPQPSSTTSTPSTSPRTPRSSS